MADSQSHPLMEEDEKEDADNEISGQGTTKKPANDNPKKTKKEISTEAKIDQQEKDACAETRKTKVDENGKIEMLRSTGNEQGQNGQKRTEQNQGTPDKSKLEQKKGENGKKVPQGTAGERNYNRTESELISPQRSFSDVTRQGPLSSQPTMHQSTKQVKTYNNVCLGNTILNSKNKPQNFSCFSCSQFLKLER